MKTLRQEQSLMTEVELSPTETEEASPSRTNASPGEEEEEQAERTRAPRDTPKRNPYKDCRTRTMSDPGADWASYNQQWRSGKGHRKPAAQRHIEKPPEEEGPFKELPKRLNTHTDRHEYKCECFDIWYDPEDMEKSVSNMKAHFFNKRKATWDKEKRGGTAGAKSPRQRKPRARTMG